MGKPYYKTCTCGANLDPGEPCEKCSDSRRCRCNNSKNLDTKEQQIDNVLGYAVKELKDNDVSDEVAEEVIYELWNQLKEIIF